MKLLNQNVIGPHVQGLRIVSDFASTIINEKDDSSINYYNMGYEHVNFLEKVLKNTFFNRKQLAQKLRNQKGYFGDNITIGFTGPKKNENGSVQVLQYQNQKITVIGTFEGQSYRKSIP